MRKRATCRTRCAPIRSAHGRELCSQPHLPDPTHLITMPRQRRRDPTPDFELPPPVPPSAIALQLRRDVRMAVIAQFCSLFAPHVNLEYSTEVSSRRNAIEGGLRSPTVLFSDASQDQEPGTAMPMYLVTWTKLTRFSRYQDLEQDLDDSRPLNCVPRILGKLINTLANDRNTK